MPTPDPSSRSGHEPVPVLTGSPILVVLRAMDSAGVRQATVVRRGAPLGTVTEQDIRRAVVSGLDLRTPIDQVLGARATEAPRPKATRPETPSRDADRDTPPAPEPPFVEDPPEGQGVSFVRPRAEMDAEALPAVPLVEEPPFEEAPAADATPPEADGPETPAEPEALVDAGGAGRPGRGRTPDPELVVPPRPAADRGPSASTRTPAERVQPAREVGGMREDEPRVVVTGGAGYLGSVLVRRLLAQGFRVTVLDRMLYGGVHLDALLEATGAGVLEIVEGDVRHIEEVEPHVRGATAVLHLADLDGIDLVKAEPAAALQTNVLATGALAQAASYLRVRRFVYASTTALYKPPRTATARIGEAAPLHASSLYAKFKRAAETLVLDEAAPHFTPTVLRLADVYGPSPRPRLGTVVNDVAMQAVRDVRVVLRAESHAIPAVHVEDAARAFLHVLNAPSSHVGHQTFNVVGANVTVLALEQLLRDLVPEIRVLYTDAEPGVGVAVGRVSGEKAHTWLGFAPQQRFAESLEALMAEIAGGYARDLPRTVTHNAEAYAALDEEVAV